MAGSVPHVMISHAMWRSRFGSDPAAVGSTVTLNGQPALVIEIVPATFEGFLVDWNGPTSV